MENEKREGRVRNLYPFYEARAGRAGRAVFVLGSSQVVEGLDAALVERVLAAHGAPREVFNLGVAGESPLVRLPELGAIERCRPGCVVFTVASFSLSRMRFSLPDQLALVADFFADSGYGAPSFRGLLPENLRNELERGPLSRWTYYRKFLDSAVKARMSAPSSHLRAADHNHNWKDPWEGLVAPDPDNVRRYLAAGDVKEMVWYGPDLLGDQPGGAPNAEREAFRFTLDAARRWRERYGTTIVVVDMPVNPLFLDHPGLRPEWLASYRAFLERETAARGFALMPWSRLARPEQFTDVLHLAAAGRETLSIRLGEVLAAAFAASPPLAATHG